MMFNIMYGIISRYDHPKRIGFKGLSMVYG